MFRLAATIGLIIAALAAFDQFLKNTEEAELRGEAKHFDARGSELLALGKVDEAVEAFRRAHSLDRRHLSYQLDLTDALMKAGKLGEAAPLIDEVLQREPNDGRANLIAARLALKRGNLKEVEPYYHRAVYGRWPDDGPGRRLAARMELIGYLEKNGSKRELLAELLPVEEDAGNNAALQRRLAHLFLIAGSASRAADLYHTLIQHDSQDASAYAGLGEVELERGRYREARNAFLEALRRKPGDASILQRSGLSSTMASLDPTPRRLPSLEKYARSLRILELTRGSLQECSATAVEETVPEPTPAHATNELAEESLARAEELWRERIKTCGPAVSAKDEPLRLIMEKIAQ